MKCIQVFVVLGCLGGVFGNTSVLNETTRAFNKINLGTFDLMVDTRVVGGQTAPEGAIPWQASLRDSSNSHFCGGSVISSKFILTAAHCVAGGAPATVVVGTNKRTIGGQRYQVQGVLSYPQYDPATQRHDIALVKLVSPIKMTDRVKDIRLAQEDTAPGTVLLLTGWGRTSYPGSPADNLQYIKLATISQPECSAKLSQINSVYTGQICTMTKVGEGACHGDSGGPLVNRNSVVGIVSWGYPCAKGYPDVFTKVFAYKQWIERVINSSP